jgi:hypothetical protein
LAENVPPIDDAQPIDREPLKALFSLDYHVARLRAEAGHKGYAAWGERARSIQDVPSTFRPASLERTFERLGQLYGLNNGLHDRHKRHARGKVAMALATAARAGGRWGDEAARWMKLAGDSGMLTQEHFDLLGNVRHRSPIGAYMALGTSPSCVTSNESEDFSFDLFEVTSLSVEFDVNRPVSSLRKLFDPRMWDVSGEQCFKHADQIPDAERSSIAPGFAGASPPPALPSKAEEIAVAGQSWHGLFYENAVGAVGEMTLTDFRNFLHIDFTASDEQIDTEYSLSEGISMDILGSGFVAGGLDRDAGIVRVRKLTDDSCHVFASKSVRVGQPADRRDILNINMAATLPFWFYSLVLLGVCENFNP